MSLKINYIVRSYRKNNKVKMILEKINISFIQQILKIMDN